MELGIDVDLRLALRFVGVFIGFWLALPLIIATAKLCEFTFCFLSAFLGSAFALSQLQSGYPTVQKLAQATGLPVIGAISQVATPAAKQVAKRRNKLFAGSLAALGGLYALLLVVDMIQRSGVA